MKRKYRDRARARVIEGGWMSSLSVLDDKCKRRARVIKRCVVCYCGVQRQT